MAELLITYYILTDQMGLPIVYYVLRDKSVFVSIKVNKYAFKWGEKPADNCLLFPQRVNSLNKRTFSLMGRLNLGSV